MIARPKKIYIIPAIISNNEMDELSSGSTSLSLLDSMKFQKLQCLPETLQEEESRHEKGR